MAKTDAERALERQQQQEQSALRRESLRSRVGRRVSVLPSNASTNRDVEDPWLIATVEQLSHKVRTNAKDVLDMIKELREGHDAAKELLDRLDTEEARVDQVNGSALAAQARNVALSSRAREAETAAVNLQARVDVLEEQLEDSEQARQLLLRQSRGSGGNGGNGGSPSPSTFTNNTNSDSKKSQKHPDPPTFTGDQINGPGWYEWSLAIDDKLTINTDHWATDDQRARYVISRTGNEALKHLTSYRMNNPNYFQHPTQVKDALKDIYEDKFRRQNARREYQSCKMKKDEPFGVFFPRFRRLGNELEHSELTLCEDLKDKVLPRMRDSLINNQKRFTKLADMREYCQGLDDEQRNVLAQEARRLQFQESKRKSTEPVAAPRYTRPTSATPAVTIMQRPPIVNATPTPVPPKSYTFNTGADSDNCFNCGEPGHIARNCTKPKQELAGIHEIVEESEEELDSENV